jgi:hypothetical protein
MPSCLKLPLASRLLLLSSLPLTLGHIIICEIVQACMVMFEVNHAIPSSTMNDIKDVTLVCGGMYACQVNLFMRALYSAYRE